MDEFSKLRLAGGTALALQIGHRKSIDLDFFGSIEFEQLAINELFKGFHGIEVLQKTRNINIFPKKASHSQSKVQKGNVVDLCRL